MRNRDLSWEDALVVLTDLPGVFELVTGWYDGPFDDLYRRKCRLILLRLVTRALKEMGTTGKNCHVTLPSYLPPVKDVGLSWLEFPYRWESYRLAVRS